MFGCDLAFDYLKPQVKASVVSIAIPRIELCPNYPVSCKKKHCRFVHDIRLTCDDHPIFAIKTEPQNPPNTSQYLLDFSPGAILPPHGPNYYPAPWTSHPKPICSYFPSTATMATSTTAAVIADATAPSPNPHGPRPATAASMAATAAAKVPLRAPPQKAPISLFSTQQPPQQPQQWQMQQQQQQQSFYLL